MKRNLILLIICINIFIQVTAQQKVHKQLNFFAANHPDLAGHQLIAKELNVFVKKLMNW
jgi:hypothetical protein